MSVVAEVMQWHPASDKPDCDITVLLWFPKHQEWHAGWCDGDVWRDACSGGITNGASHWAEPEGPPQ